MTLQSVFQLEVANPIEALNGGLFVSNGRFTHETRRLDSFELIFVARGSLELFEDSRELSLQAGSTLILWPERRHGARHPFPPDLRFYWLHFRLRRTAKSTGDAPLRLPQIVSLAEPERLSELFRRFLVDQEYGYTSRLTADNLVSLMLSEISDAARHCESRRTRPGEALADRVDALIAESYHRRISTKPLARRLGYHPDYIERIYRRSRGFSVSDRINEIRIKEARALLRTDEKKNVDEIAFSCGYRYPSYFRRMFKRAVGVTPVQYRRLYHPAHINTH